MNTKNWKLKDVLLIAISAVLFGVVYLGCTYIGGVLYGMLTPFGMASLGYEPFYGIYFMAGAFGIYVMRKPGTGLIAELLAAVLECLYGNYFGPIIILSGLNETDNIVESGLSALDEGDVVRVIAQPAKTNVGGIL